MSTQPKHCIWSMDDEEEDPAAYRVDPAWALRTCLERHILAGTHIPYPLYRDLIGIAQDIQEAGA